MHACVHECACDECFTTKPLSHGTYIYKPKFIVPQMHFMIHPQDSLAFGIVLVGGSTPRSSRDLHSRARRGDAAAPPRVAAETPSGSGAAVLVAGG